MTVPYTNARYLLKRDQILTRQKERYHSDPLVREKKREYDIQYRRHLKETLGTTLTQTRREGHYRRRYGITIADYDRLLEQQGALCKICRRVSLKKLAVDHDHTTGKVRGLLCASCNKGLGQFDDDPKRITSAAMYLWSNK